MCCLCGYVLCDDVCWYVVYYDELFDVFGEVFCEMCCDVSVVIVFDECDVFDVECIE